ncbi:MAG: DegV family protein [Atopobiaceae bacterium]|jgi:DegV family protein with EDD domain|nr:DegV family protein [Atopobiaceae bacterium]
MNKLSEEESIDPKLTMSSAPEDVVSVGRAFHQRRTCRIIVDSSGDFAPEVVHRLGVEFIPFTYVTPEGEVEDDLWESIGPHEFYETLRKNPELHYSTCAITPGRYLEIFEKAAQEGLPTIYLCLTAGLSSSIHNARQAAEMVRENHPGFELYVVDTRCDSAAAELLAIEVTRQATRGLTARELYEWAREARYFIHGYFTLDGFSALAAGGRIPPAAATVGGKLDIKPELSYDTNGALSLCGMCRGRKKALRAILQDFRDNYGHDPSLPLAIVSADAEKDANWLEKEVRKQEGCSQVTIIRSQVSPILGSHVGPGMVALVFWGTDRREKLSFTDKLARKVRGRSKEA